ncbi:glycosyltransferase family 2 protein [Haloplanus aerogenes]|nr:glycosyltransferase family 2 protein [Haloplanus aerogenes]RMB23568.1 cellulose synthase/poly-beta-1,6-N-acetylglucosamine synthase-like glycosyltransferase [Haloplanus aerogenes]
MTTDNSKITSVSIIIPTHNEEQTIESCLDALISADCESHKEILVVDGQSEDRTREQISSYEQAHQCVSLYDNPQQTTPHGINIGLENATGEVVSFISGHSIVSEQFFNHIMTAFDRAPDADVVGGRMVPSPETYFEHSVAAALISRLGASSSRFRPVEGYVETVNFGAYRREVIETVGKMDTDLPRAQDYEYNKRVRAAGFRLYQYPELQISYVPRSTPLALAKQYYGNGYWKANVFNKLDEYPLPPRVCGLAMIILGSVTIPLWPLMLGSYLIIINFVAISSIRTSKVGTDMKHIPGAVLALFIMHSSFALGILHGSISP